MVGTVEPGGLQEWRSHWAVILPSFLGIMLISAHGHALGVMIRPLEEEFGWPRAQISTGFLFLSVLALFVSPFAGRAIDRYGARRIALFGIPFYCSTLACLSLATSSVFSWWALWIWLGLGSMAILPAVWVSAINGYFFKSRGLAMAVALSGTGMGAALWPMIVNALLEALGWRMAYVALGALSAAVIFPVAFLLFRENASRAGASLATDASGAEPAGLGATARQQMTSAKFVKLAAAALIFAVATGALTQNLVPVLIGEGLTPATAAATAGLLGLGSIVGRLAGGYLLDRFDGNKVAAISVVLPIIPAMIFLFADQSQAWAATACIIMGLAVGAEYDCCAYLAARHFGTRNFGTLFGSMSGMLLFGVGLSPIAANYIYDVTRSYDLVMMLLVPLFLTPAVLFLALGSYRDIDPETGERLAST